MPRTATNPETGERIQFNEQTQSWVPMEPIAPEAQTPGIAPSFASGAARGALEFADIIPKGIAGGINVAANMLPESVRPPELDIAPFTRMGAALGIGRVEPVTPGERHAAFAGEMLGSSIGPGGIATRVAGLPGLAGEAIAVTGAALGGMVSEEMGAGRLPGTLAGGLAPTALTGMARRAMLPQQAAEAPERVAAAQRQGLPLSVGQATGGSWVERTTETLPGGATAKAGFAQNQADLMRQRLSSMTAGPTEPGAMAAGEAISQGINDWAGRFRGKARELYDRAEEFVPRATMVEPGRLRKTVSELHGKGAFAGITDNPLTTRIATALDEVPEGGVTYEDMRELRTMIGRQLSTPSLVADAPRAELKQLYGAISQDMQDTMQAVGGENATGIWREADDHWKAGMERIDKILEPIQKRKTPEEVYKAAMAGTKEGATRIRTLRDSLSDEQWDLVRRTTMRKMGEVTPGAQLLETATASSGEFNPERFLTNIAGMRPEAREVLFEGARDFNDLTRVASGVQQAANYMRNPSGTARMLAQAAVPAAGVAAFYDPSIAAGAAGLMTGAYGAQKFLQSPTGLRWATQPPELIERGLGGMLPRGQSALE